MGYTALMLAAQKGNERGAIIKYLVERGADIDLQNKYHATALMMLDETASPVPI